MTRRRAVLACALAAAVQVGALAPHASAQIADKRAQAAELQRKIEAQGQKLSLADEKYNMARVQRQRIDTQATAARAGVAAAEQRWTQLRAQLAKRVRVLYMHPGAPIDAWLGANSIADLARRHKFGSAVLGADSKLVDKTEAARQQLLAKADHLDGIKDSAKAKEREMAAARSEVSGAVAEQRSLLRSVNGDIAKLMEEQRKRDLAAAQAAAAAQPTPAPGDGPQPTVAPPAIGDGSGDPVPTATPEPVGPAPPVKSGAGKAVATAAAQIGKPYEWAAEGPDTYDCSGLTMYAWAAAGVSLVHSSQAQYASLPHVERSQIAPGDLLFYGSPIHHVGIYEGGGVMINAPQTGEFVRRDSIARSDYVGAARP